VCNLVEKLLFSILILGSVFNDYVVFYRDVYMSVMCICKYECMHCIIIFYFVATCKGPFGPLLLNKMNEYCRTGSREGSVSKLSSCPWNNVV